MVGYDTTFKRDDMEDGWALMVFMHWYNDEKPPKNRREALKRLKDIIGFPEELIKINKKEV